MTNPGTIPADHPELGTRQARDPGAGNPTSLGPGTAGNPGHVHLEVTNPGRSQLHEVSLGSLQEGDRSDSEESFHEVSLGSLQEGDRSDSEERIHEVDGIWSCSKDPPGTILADHPELGTRQARNPGHAHLKVTNPRSFGF